MSSLNATSGCRGLPGLDSICKTTLLQMLLAIPDAGAGTEKVFAKRPGRCRVTLQLQCGW